MFPQFNIKKFLIVYALALMIVSFASLSIPALWFKAFSLMGMRWNWFDLYVYIMAYWLWHNGDYLLGRHKPEKEGQ